MVSTGGDHTVKSMGSRESNGSVTGSTHNAPSDVPSRRSVHFNAGPDDAKSIKSTKSTLSQGGKSIVSRQKSTVVLSATEAIKSQVVNSRMLGNHSYLFFPWTKGYQWWFWWTVIWSVLTIFFELYAIAFLPGGTLPPNNPASIIEYCFSAVFGLDILINFNLAYTNEEDVVVMDRKQVFWKYFKRWFWYACMNHNCNCCSWFPCTV
jgi:hypothetical protein